MKKVFTVLSGVLLATFIFARVTPNNNNSPVLHEAEGGFSYLADAGNTTVNVHAGNKSTYSIGDFAHGGVVFWVDETGQHGLVCAKEDQSTGVIWGRSFGDTHANKDGIYTGKRNTAIIIAAQEAMGDKDVIYAARICNELEITVNGETYDDWYLPSRKEVNLMWQSRAAVNRTALANGGSSFESNGFYWSSNEYTDNLAWIQLFYTVSQHYYFKSDIARVRAIRAF